MSDDTMIRVERLLDGMRPGWPKLLDSLANTIRTEVV